MNILVTGGAGFIGSNFVRGWIDRHPDDKVIVVDLLTYAGNLASLEDLAGRHTFVHGDIADLDLMSDVLRGHSVDIVVNFAAESHNSYAIVNPGAFFRTNVLGTQTLCEAARRVGVARLHHISTCEVYGDLDLDTDEVFTESSPYRPRTPYNASKAGGDHAVRAYSETFGLPVTITNCANNYGPYQFPEKVLPLFATNALDDEPLPLYESTQNRREWIHVDDHCRAIEVVIEHGRVGETYHVGTGVEKSIEEIADGVLEALGKPSTLKAIVPDRPGHDRRYVLDSTKIRDELGWQPTVDFEVGLRETVGLVRGEPVLVGAAPGARPCAGSDSLEDALKVLVTGAAGQVGREVVERLEAAPQHEVVGLGSDALDVSDRDAVLGSMATLAPDAVVHAAAWTAVDACESDPDRAYAVNALGTRHVAEACGANHAHLLALSTDYVFDGAKAAPYVEWDAPNPASVYGRSKLAGEEEALRLPGATVVRTSWVCGFHGSNVVKTVLRLAGEHETLDFVDDQHGNPTLAADLALMIERLLVSRMPGIHHVTNQGAVSWYEFARTVMEAAGLDPGRVQPISTADLNPPRPARRPRNSVLDNASLRLSGIALLPHYAIPLQQLVTRLQAGRR